eukprot:CAMPEP_0201930108 /NCGR_PEP_ID=MMETSP0903-20130614/24486_1 /ASSEMBLY_ACC=CAM_ASM_000552 /TAXON_ID=420261 /ORGANISM="Thalassiosira antarctica, Strain CCMP982" /LENGTH=267 /DNA_ID=CAMNT_0048469091 /DNA_START=82 /DNA_END=885 /DNA_ORIENTATION=-
MIMINKSNKTFITGLIMSLLFFVLFQAVLVFTAVASCSNDNEIEMQGHCRLYPPKAKTLVLSINAANGFINWERVNTLVDSGNWEVQELILENFGSVMKEKSLTDALESSYHIMKDTLERLQPDILLASSKGVGVIAYLASKELWIKRPVILFSPIPNPIDGLVDGSSYELEWSDTIDVMRHHNLGPIMVAAGSSTDEEMFISEALREPSACGEMHTDTGTFEKCKDWRHVVVPGDHHWKNLHKNEAVISKLIDYIVLWIEKGKGDD